MILFVSAFLSGPSIVPQSTSMFIRYCVDRDSIWRYSCPLGASMNSATCGTWFARWSGVEPASSPRLQSDVALRSRRATTRPFWDSVTAPCKLSDQPLSRSKAPRNGRNHPCSVGRPLFGNRIRPTQLTQKTVPRQPHVITTLPVGAQTNHHPTTTDHRPRSPVSANWLNSCLQPCRRADVSGSENHDRLTSTLHHGFQPYSLCGHLGNYSGL